MGDRNEAEPSLTGPEPRCVESSKQMNSGDDNIVDLNDGCDDNLRESVGFNGTLNKGVDLNNGFVEVEQLDNCDADLRNVELDLNAGFNLNLNDGVIDIDVCYEETKKAKEGIDLNLDVNSGEMEEDLEMVESQRREHCFDLNLGVDDDHETSEDYNNSEYKKHFNEQNNEASVFAETRNMENSAGDVEVTLVKDEFTNLTLVEVNVDEDYRTDFVGGSIRESIISCQDFMAAVVEPGSAVTVGSSYKAGRGRRRKNVSDSMGVTIRTTEGRVHDSNGIQLKEGLLESGSALIDGSHGDAVGPQKLGRGRRKSRRLFGDLNTDSAVIDKSRDDVGIDYKQGRGRRKSRKLSDAMEATAVIVAGDTNFVFSEENKLRVSDDIHSKVESKKQRGRKRKNVEENVNAVLRRSSRRGSLRHNDSSTTLYEESLSPSVSEEMEEKMIALDVERDEEPVIVPPKLQLPPCSRDLDLEGLPVLNVFSIYACLRSFSTLLFLSPFQLEDFVAALKRKSPSILFDCVHVSILQTLRKHLEILANEGSETASNCIRSLNWDLIDLITWPVFMAEYLMIHGAESRPGFDLNLLKMFKSDYYNQPVSVKVEILRCLCDDLIEVDAVRLELNRRSSATEHELDFDRNTTIDGYRRKRATLDLTNGSCLTEEIADDSNDWNIDECCLCKMDGSLICCDGCPAAYHSKCVGIAHDILPQGDWYCPECATNRLVPRMKPCKSIRGAEILGIDPHGRVYFNSCGYLLVSESWDVDGLFTFYHRDDLNAVIDVLKSSEYFYSGIIKGIYRQWELPTGTGLNRASRNLGSLNTPTTDGMPDHSEYKQAHIAAAMEGLSTSSEAAAAKENPDDRNVDKLMRDCTNTAGEVSNPSEGPEISQRLADSFLKTGSSDIKQESGGRRDLAKESMLQTPCEISYFNHYSFAQAAASVVEELTSKSANKGNDVLIKLKSEEEIISIQMKAILKHCQKFWWPNLQSLSADALKEKCGWCYLCRGSDDDLDCLFKMNMSLIKEGSKSDVVGLLSKRNKKGHLVDVICHVLSIEDRLCGLLLGPWLNPHYSKIWRKSVLKAPDLMSLKHFLITLETNLHPRAISAEWSKHVDSSVTLGSACHVVIATSRTSLKKRARGTEIENKPSSNAATGGLYLCWWRGGRLSREVFNWKVLPRSLASKAARQAGWSKIPGILYPESSDFAKRSKNLTWRAAVESATSPEQLSFQVREFDSNLKWHDFENTHPPSTLDKEALKSIRLFRKAVVRRKSTEGDVNYLIDFGNKRRSIPDVVAKHGVIVEEPSNERKKYWLNECYMPLHLLKSFEEKRIVRKLNNISSGKLREDSIAVKKTSKERGFSYLFARAEKSIYHLCGHCSKDVLISEAACCQYCEGFFHKRHVRKSAGSIVTESIYTCHKCHSGKSEKKKKNGKTLKGRGNVEVKVKLETGKKVSTALTACRSARLIKGKKLGRGRGRPPKSKNVNNKAVTGVPLRRSPRNFKYVPLDKKTSQSARKENERLEHQ